MPDGQVRSPNLSYITPNFSHKISLERSGDGLASASHVVCWSKERGECGKMPRPLSLTSCCAKLEAVGQPFRESALSAASQSPDHAHEGRLSLTICQN